MNRRTFLSYTFATLAGAGVATAFYRTRQAPQEAVAGAGDLEQTLLRIYDPENSQITASFPDVSSFDEARQLLEDAGLVAGGRMQPAAMEHARLNDPIVEFGGWQRFESELLLLLAAQHLVNENFTRGTGDTTTFAFDKYTVYNGSDFYGHAIDAFRIDTNEDYLALMQCMDLCTQTPACNFITLGKSTHPIPEKQNVCWLVDERHGVRQEKHYFAAKKK